MQKSGLVRCGIRFVPILHLGLSVAILTGCAETPYPVTTGFHVPVAQNAQTVKRRYVIWSNHPAVEQAIIEGLQNAGHTVIDRTRVEDALPERKSKPIRTHADEAAILDAAQRIEVERVVFAQVTITPAVVGRTNHSPSSNGDAPAKLFFSGAFFSDPAFNAEVSVHSVAVDTGELRWSGTASYPAPITNPDKGAVSLARIAIARAKCLVTAGFEWKELDETGGGCLLRNPERK